MKEFPIIESDEIVLRKLQIEDYDNFLDYVNDDLIAKQFKFNHTPETCKTRLEELINRYDSDNKPYVWAIALKKTNVFIGIISCDKVSNSDKNISLACAIRKNYRGNHYAYKAIKLLINYFFQKTDIHRIEAAHNIDNIASKKTIEKLGFIYEGIARESRFYVDKFVDRKIYSILKDEWKNSNEK